MNKELRTVILLNYIYIAITNLSSVIITPFLTRGLSPVEYGIYGLAYSTFCYFLVMDFGIGAMVVRNVSEYRLKKEDKEQENFLFAALFMFIIFGALATLFCSGINAGAHFIFQKTFDLQAVGMFRVMFGILIVNLFFLFLQNYFFCIISGYEKYVFTKVVFIIKLLIRGISIPLFMLSKGSAWWIFALDLAMTVLNVIVFAIYCFAVLKIKVKFHFFDKVLTKNLYVRTAMIYLSMILENVYWNATSLVISATVGPEETGVFFIGLTFCQIFVQLSSTITGYFLPGVTKLVVEKASRKQFTDQMVSVARPIAILLGLVLLGFITVGRDFLSIWVGPRFTPAYIIAALVLSALLFVQIEVYGETFLQATNKYTARFIICIFNTLGCVAINFFVISKWGFTYSWVGYVATIVIFRLGLMNFNYHKAGLNIPDFLRRMLPRLLLLLAVTGGECYLISLIKTANVFWFLLKAVLVVLVYAVNLWLLYLSKEEKAAVIGKVMGVLKRNAKA